MMSERIDKNQPTLEELRELLEREKVELTREFARKTSAFLAKDDEFNGMVLRVFNLVIETIQKNPGTVLRSGRTDVDEVLSELRKQRERGPGLGEPGIEGGDVVGADWIDDLERIVKALSGVVKEEKDFFLQIIRLIFCGC